MLEAIKKPVIIPEHTCFRVYYISTLTSLIVCCVDFGRSLCVGGHGEASNYVRIYIIRVYYITTLTSLIVSCMNFGRSLCVGGHGEARRQPHMDHGQHAGPTSAVTE